MCLSNDLFEIYPLLPRDESAHIVIEYPDPMNSYSGFGWAAERDNKTFWQPVGMHYWPPNIERDNSAQALIALFKSKGYILLNIGRDRYNDYINGRERIAIYINNDNTPTHAARQLAGGLWTSKLSWDHKIEHSTLGFLESPHFGNVVEVMERDVMCQQSERQEIWCERGHRF